MHSVEPSSRMLRTSTLASSAASSKPYSQKRKARIILTPSKTPSLHTIPGEHDCFAVDAEKTAAKVTMRFFFSAFRFALAYSWHCHTWRGSTLENGAKSSCGGLCQAAHAALTPNLQDDRLEIILKELTEMPFDKITPEHQSYFESRFSLTAEDLLELQDESPQKRKTRAQTIINRLQPKEHTSTFANTRISMVLNTTFGNPRASNRIDCALEKILRPLEDALTEQCRNEEINPKEALSELQDRYKSLLKDLWSKLETGQEDLTALANSYEELRRSELDLFAEIKACNLEIARKKFTRNSSKEVSPPNISFESMLETIDPKQRAALIHKISICKEKAKRYRSCFDKRFSEATGGVPALEQLKKSLQLHQPTSILKVIFKDSEEPEETLELLLARASHLNADKEFAEEFKAAQEEIQRRQDEVSAQMSVAFTDFDHIHTLVKQELYQKRPSSEGPLQTPTKQDLNQKFLSFIKKLTPGRSDLQRTFKRRRIGELPEGKGKEEEALFSVPSSTFKAEKAYLSSPPFTLKKRPLFETLENENPNPEKAEGTFLLEDLLDEDL